jgi:hypothetical protein
MCLIVRKSPIAKAGYNLSAMKTTDNSVTFVLISIVCYGISLTQDAFCTQSSCVLADGALIVGWAGLYMGGIMLTWMANPLIFMAWLTVRRFPKISNICSVTATTLMLSFLCYKQIYNHQDEWTSDITHYGLGYYLWVATGVSMVIGNACLPKPKKLKNYKLL